MMSSRKTKSGSSFESRKHAKGQKPLEGKVNILMSSEERKLDTISPYSSTLSSTLTNVLVDMESLKDIIGGAEKIFTSFQKRLTGITVKDEPDEIENVSNNILVLNKALDDLKKGIEVFGKWKTKAIVLYDKRIELAKRQTEAKIANDMKLYNQLDIAIHDIDSDISKLAGTLREPSRKRKKYLEEIEALKGKEN